MSFERPDEHLTPQQQAEEAKKEVETNAHKNTETVTNAFYSCDWKPGKEAVDSVAKRVYTDVANNLDPQNPDYQTNLGKLNAVAIQFQGEMNALYARGNISAEEVINQLAQFQEKLEGVIGATEKGDGQRAEQQKENMEKSWIDRAKQLQEWKDEFLKKLAEEIEKGRATQQREWAAAAKEAGDREQEASQNLACGILENEGWSFPEKPKG